MTLPSTALRPQIGARGPALESSAQEYEPIGVDPEEAEKMIQGLECLCCYGQPERAGVVQSGEQKAPGRPYHVLSELQKEPMIKTETIFVVEPVGTGQGEMVLS